MTGSDVASTGTKALGESTHHYVNVSRINAPVLCHTTTSLPHGSNAVSLVQVNVRLMKEREREREKVDMLR